MVVLVNNEHDLRREAAQALRALFAAFPGFRLKPHVSRGAADKGYDLLLEAISRRARFRLCVEVKSRLTPQIALFVVRRLRESAKDMIPVIYAPIISPRVAQILREQQVSYADRAGNCWIWSARGQLLIERQGFHTERQPTPAAADPFSPRSSRIVRVLLSQPHQGWQVRQLAEHPDVQVSPGLVVKVKRALLQEGYAVERDRLLYLRDPVGLLNAWSEKYAGPAEQVPLYFRGDAAEQTLSRWCQDNALQHALAGFSAAWRLAPEVRYTVGAVYVENRGFDQVLLEQLSAEYGGKRVATGPNVYLWRPFDRSVFVSSERTDSTEPPVTSGLQTYLDLKRAAGRGEDAANAVFEKLLSRDLHAAVKREEERRDGAV